MLQIKELTNSIFTSKTYILYHEDNENSWIVDVGDIQPVLSFLREKNLNLEGVVLTHAHFDHIYGLPELMNYYPQCKVYATEYAKKALASDKLNMSRYHETPIRYNRDNVVIVHEGDEVDLYEGEDKLYFYETPGHNPGCLTMIIGDMVFTGDAYIPGVGANTRVPHSNKEQAKQSLERILKLAEGKMIFPGHYVK